MTSNVKQVSKEMQLPITPGWWDVERDGQPYASVLGSGARHVAAYLLELAEWRGGRFTPLGGGKYLMGICNHQFVFQKRRKKRL